MKVERNRLFKKKKDYRPPTPKGPLILFFMAAIALLMGAVYYTGIYQEPLEKLTVWYEQPESPRGKYEIVYYGFRKCESCQIWKRDHLPKFKQSSLARNVRIRAQNASCRGGRLAVNSSIYVRTCNAIFGLQPGDEKLAFALIDKRANKVITTALGIKGFYEVTKGAERQIAHYVPYGSNALHPSATVVPQSDPQLEEVEGHQSVEEPQSTEEKNAPQNEEELSKGAAGRYQEQGDQ